MDTLDPTAAAAVDAFLTRYPADGMRILDVGCRDGRLRDHLEAYHRGFLSYRGVDAEAKVTAARRRRPDLHRDFAARDVVAAPFPDGMFDLVLAVHGDPPGLDILAAIAGVAALRLGSEGVAAFAP